MILLADRLAEIFSLTRREARKPLGDLHVLLLVDRDPVARARDRLQALVDVRHRLAPVLAGRIRRDVGHRAWAIERDEGDQILELRRLDEPQRLAHSGRLELEDADRVAAAEHRVCLRVVERERRDVDAVADQPDSLLDHVEVAQAEEVDLQQPECLDVAHRVLRHDFAVGPLLLQRHELHQRLGGDDDPGRVDRVCAGQPLERPREIDDLLRHRVRVDRLAQLRAGAECVLEHLPRPLGHELRNPVDDAVGDLEYASRVADRGPRRHGRKGDDLRDAVAPVLLGDVVDDAIAAADGKVDVGIGHRLAPRVEEAFEEQVVPDRVDVGDVEAVGDETPCGGPTARPDADTVALRERNEVPDDQEVVHEAHFADRLELVAKAVGQLRRDLPVAALEPLLAELDEVVECIAAARDRELGQQDLTERDLDRAALRDLQRAAQRLLVPGEVQCHLLGRLEEELVGVEAPVVRVLERVARLDAQKRLVRGGVVRLEVMHVAGRDQRQSCLDCQGSELWVDPLLVGQAGVLQLDVRGVAPEDLRQPVEVGARVGRPRLLERPADPPGEAAGERDQTFRVPFEQLPVDARLVVVALQVAQRGELDQVGVALIRLGEQRQVCVALPLQAAVVADVDLAADDRLDAVTGGLAVEGHGTGERAVVGERHGRHLEPRGLLAERRDPARPVEDRILGVDMQVDERGTQGRAIVLAGPDE